MAARNRDDDEGDERAKDRPSQFRIWFEHAWEGWLKSISLIIVLGGAYLAYRATPETDRSEMFFGTLLVLAVLLGALGATALPAWPLVKRPAARALFVLMVAFWAVGDGYLAIRAALPPRPLGEVRLTSAQSSATLRVDKPGPLDALVSGHFKRQGMQEAEANFVIKVSSGANADEIDGTLKRSVVSLRTSRRGGRSTTVQEQTEVRRPLSSVRGPGELTFSSDSIDDKELEDGITIAVRPAGLNPILFIVMGALAVLLALGFDTRITDAKTKTKTYLTAGTATALVFAINFAETATPHSLVRPAVSAAVLSILVGALGGWVVSALARLLFGPKPVAKKPRR